MNPLILVVDDDPDIVDLMVFNLQKESFLVQVAFTGVSALRKLDQAVPDLMILDLKLPDQDGLSVLEKVRQNARTADVPVMIVSAKSDLADRIAGLEQGGSDYISKPFSPRELILRAQALLRRSSSSAGIRRDKADAPFKLEQNTLSVSLDGNRVYLSATEFKLLRALAAKEGEILLREELHRNLSGKSLSHHSRALDAHVMRLRKKLENYSDCIDTIRGVGYRFALGSKDSKLKNA